VNRLTIIFAPKSCAMITHVLTAGELRHLINTSENLLIYFYNDNCAPCLSLRPKVEGLVLDRFPRMDMAYVNSAQFPELVGEFNAFGFPVLIFFFEGKEFLRYSKYVSIVELEESIGRIYRLYYGQQSAVNGQRSEDLNT
jgi:thioredoxin-like negative regulator of GroEL